MFDRQALNSNRYPLLSSCSSFLDCYYPIDVSSFHSSHSSSHSSFCFHPTNIQQSIHTNAHTHIHTFIHTLSLLLFQQCRIPRNRNHAIRLLHILLRRLLRQNPERQQRIASNASHMRLHHRHHFQNKLVIVVVHRRRLPRLRALPNEVQHHQPAVFHRSIPVHARQRRDEHVRRREWPRFSRLNRRETQILLRRRERPRFLHFEER